MFVSLLRLASFASTFFIALFILPLATNNDETLEYFFDGYLKIATIFLVAGVFCSIFYPSLSYYEQGRYGGIFVNPNILGYISASVLVILVNKCLHEDSGQKRLWMVGNGLFVSVLLYLSASRASILLAVVGVFVLCYLNRRYILLFGVSLLFLFILFTNLLISYEDTTSFLINQLDYLRINPQYVTLQDVMSGRLDQWKDAINSFSNNPFWGVGFGAFGEGGYAVLNSYIAMAVQTGLVGVFLYFGLIMLLMCRIYLNCKKTSNVSKPMMSNLAKTYALLLAVLVGTLLHSLFESTLTTIGNPLAFLMWVTLGYGMHNQPQYYDLNDF